jgi:hypothetical protein
VTKDCRHPTNRRRLCVVSEEDGEPGKPTLEPGIPAGFLRLDSFNPSEPASSRAPSTPKRRCSKPSRSASVVCGRLGGRASTDADRARRGHTAYPAAMTFASGARQGHRSGSRQTRSGHGKPELAALVVDGLAELSARSVAGASPREAGRRARGEAGPEAAGSTRCEPAPYRTARPRPPQLHRL